jgi:hypothetical protein
MSENQQVPGNFKSGEQAKVPMPKTSGEPQAAYEKFTNFLEEHDPSGIAKAYYQTVVGKYEKTGFSEGTEAADRKALDYIKKNDPSGLLKWYYEETKIGELERKAVKTIDRNVDELGSDLKQAFKSLVNQAKEAVHDLITHDTNNDHNKNLPSKPKNSIQLD